MDKVLPTAGHRCNIALKRASCPQVQGHGDGPRKLVTRFGAIQQVGYNQRFDLY